MRAAWLGIGVLALACGGAPPESTDAAVRSDASGADASIPEDAGPPGPPALAVPCEDARDAIYAASADTSRPALEVRGEIVRCAYLGFTSAPEVDARLAAASVAEVEATTGVHELLVAYRTTRPGDAAAIASALVLLPATRRTTPSPMLVAAHGTVGLADACAPSRHDTATDSLRLPFAARGWPVIAPDYAGLGTEGVQGYGDNDDTARSTLDAARALRALLPVGASSGDVVMTGHSQGGGSVLSAQALEPAYGAGGELALVIAFAAGWAVDRDARAYRFPGVSTSFGGGAPAALASLFLYAYSANELGVDRRGALFGAAVRDEVVTAVERDCVFMLASSIPTAAPTFGDLVDETFRAGMLACADGGTCTGDAQAHWEWLGANVMTPAADGAEVLMITGTADTLATPNDVACVVEHLRAAGVDPTVCVDGSTHFDVVPRGMAFATAYAEALVSAAALPGCPQSAALPACR